MEPTLRWVQSGFGIPWVPEAWLDLAREPEALALFWSRLEPVVESGEFLRESLRLLGEAFHGLANAYGAGMGVAISEHDRRGILFDLDALLFGGAQLLLGHTLLSMALRDGGVGRRGLTEGIRLPSAYRRRPVELLEKESASPRMRLLFSDIGESLQLTYLPIDVLAMAKWMRFLEPTWERFKTFGGTGALDEICRDLEHHAVAVAHRLSPRVELDPREVLSVVHRDRERDEWLRSSVEVHLATAPVIVALDAFLRVEAAVHPELQGGALTQPDQELQTR